MVATVARAMTVGGSGASGWGNDDDGSFATPSPSLLLSPPLSILSLSMCRLTKVCEKVGGLRRRRRWVQRRVRRPTEQVRIDDDSGVLRQGQRHPRCVTAADKDHLQSKSRDFVTDMWAHRLVTNAPCIWLQRILILSLSQERAPHTPARVVKANKEIVAENYYFK